MYSILEEGGRVNNGIKTYVVDAVADIQDLPDDTPIGSTVLVVATSDVYILNNQRQWQPL